MHIFEDAHFWVLVSFLIFVGLVYKPLGRIFAQILDARINNIKLDLEEATELKKEAEDLLKETEIRSKEALRESKDIVKHAKEEVAGMMEELKEKINSIEKYKRALFLKKMKEKEERTLMEIRNSAIDVSVQLAKNEILNSLAANENLVQNITDSSMKELMSEIGKK
jgi:F-type H+-transporting ATPase subunit b